MNEREDEDDKITLRPKEADGEKVASAEVTLFDKTSYKDEKITDPLEISPDKHGK